MSQSPEEKDSALTEYDEYTYGWLALSQLLSEGGSLSGREKNCCFVNTRDGRFAQISGISGLDFADDARAIAALDWDFDGGIDICLANRTGPRIRIMRNNLPAENFLALRLQGMTCNRDAIGARIELMLTDGSKLIHTVSAGDSYLSQTSKWNHFGLGQSNIESVDVRWPGEESAERFAITGDSKRFILVQGSGKASAWEAPAISEFDSPDFQIESPTEESFIRTWVASRFPVAPLRYKDDRGSNAQFPVSGSATLVNLWASWCQPCLEELSEMVEVENQLRQLGLEVIALNVDESTGKEDSKSALAVLNQLKWPFKSGVANPELLDALDIVQRILVSRRRQLPVPSSFLFDRSGQLAAVYRGRIDMDTLLADLANIEQPIESIVHGLPFEGIWLRQPSAGIATLNEIMFEFLNAGKADYAQKMMALSTERGGAGDRETMALAHLNLGVKHLENGDSSAAEQSFRQSLQLDATSYRAHLGLAKALRSQNRLKEAASHYYEVVKADPSNAEAQFEVGRAFAGAGKGAEAVFHLEAALKARADWLPPLNVLARILALHPDPEIGNPDRALQLSNRAVELSDRKDFQSLETLSVILAKQGEFKQAVAVAEEAMTLKPSVDQRQLERMQRNISAWKSQVQ